MPQSKHWQGAFSGSRADAPSHSSVSRPVGFDPERGNKPELIHGPPQYKLQLIDAENYAQGLLGEEASEIGQALGKARRFGIDTPGPKAAPYFGCTAREMLETECGDMLAAIEWAALAGLIRRSAVEEQGERKLAKLLDPSSRDNLGRRLAPAIAMEARQGRDGETRPDPKDDSAGPKDIAHNQSGQSNGE